MVVVLVCSDLHGSDEALSMLWRAERDISPDAVAICGDVTTYGSRDYIEKALSAFESDLLAVPGNCDTDEMLRMMEEAGASVHSRRVARHGLDLFGFKLRG